ncbi:MAG: hypothetical protein A2Y03_06920 [Omnitrophica WOR_2 bacterium GWF2_38_59]|nr:MAG: hypothetical protein A2Y03_06920 [Omnitrophica WOR_2 bacterium GWF2_38_59]OGX47399.1 MAG: hypothetical protein A2243_01565 [Omnitrophica WOR_2 bacterium RIFOXYA2_FULL_38_17]OGX54260.1 MAG: hypothetical protein A2267_01965 [Omnitrophica WOR_2 bacterium RIFOXYA12_FULL_38_10]OGX55038.1 MAG: hypothetical protein A2447_10925 [Omnitrophica WOR_2 bacterium RIFOXYC2_FULL_38_12]OGX60501.1 MAG: hypothetical protein A2306_07770 [Omnitrophica WOR_2 bacterium RIFOXYB2_FULL_38_16]HBG62283.1 DUF1211 
MAQTDKEVFKYGVFTKNRVETFSDGIFAIIVTLLILEVKVPHIENADSSIVLMQSLTGLFPKFISWVISFLTICIVWVNHHRIFELFRGFNIVLFWLNVQVLLWVCFIPFPTALVGDYPNNPLAVAIYGVVMALTGASLVAVRFYGLMNKDILEPGISEKTYKKAIVFSFLFGTIFYLTGAALAWVNTLLSFAVYFLITIYFIFSFKFQAHREKK